MTAAVPATTAASAARSARRPIVPLRPMSAADVLDGGFRLLRVAPAAVLVPALLVAVLVAVAQTAVTLALDPASALADSIGNGFATGLLVQLCASAIGSVGAAVIGAFLAGVVVCGLQGTAPTLPAVWVLVRGRLVAAAVVGVLVAVGQTVALAFLVVPGVWLWVWWAMAVPATVVERSGPWTAMRRSGRLARAGFWRVFGLRLLAVLTAVAFSYLFRVPFGLLADQVDGSPNLVAALGGLATLLTSAIVLPLRAAVDLMLYLDQRIRSEAFDVTLTLAAAPGANGSPA